MNNHPNFITIEGGDGVGKSTHVEALVKNLQDLGYDVLHTREPGGTELGEQLRKIALNAPMTAKTECIMMFAARNEHLEQVIRPALKAGKVVVCDRFTDSTLAYQGGARGVLASDLGNLIQIVHPDLGPGLTILFDLDENIRLQRLAATGKIPDKFESENSDFHIKVRNAYLALTTQDRFKIVDASKTMENVAKQVDDIMACHLPFLQKKTSQPKHFISK